MKWLIVVWFLNASTGEPEHQYVASKPMSLEECNQALIERGPGPVKDNQAQYAYCQKIGKNVSL